MAQLITWEPAAEAAQIVFDLIRDYDKFRRIRERGGRFIVLLRSKPQKVHGDQAIATIRVVSGLEARLSYINHNDDGEYDAEDRADRGSFWLIQIDETEWARHKEDDHWKKALMYHELRHADYTETEEGYTLTTKGHDFERFYDEIEEFGLWDEPLQRLAKTFMPICKRLLEEQDYNDQERFSNAFKPPDTQTS